MYATELIADRAFGPEALKVIGQAFEDAWAEIAGNFGEGQEETAAARTALARAVLALATNDSRDAEALKKAALLTMALNSPAKTCADWFPL